MNKSTSLAIVAALGGALSLAGAQYGVTAADAAGTSVMAPGKGITFDIGAKHAVGYFLNHNGACDLTVVVATANDGEVSQDSPGTRFQVTVQPGATARIDAASGKTGEFVCASAADKMTARVVDRSLWTPAKL
jgi:hypothetical protein